MVKTILGLTTAEIRQMMVSAGMPSFRGSQVADWIYKKGVSDFESMTNLPESLRNELKSKYRIGRSKLLQKQKSKDGAFKLLLELADLEKIETVGIPYEDRFSCCVSTQVGCPVGCIFCATGASGYKRNLDAGEIVDQVLSMSGAGENVSCIKHESEQPVNNVVFMGMGEPLLNYDQTMKALRLINQELRIGARQLTLSTVGHVPGIKQLISERMQFTLAVSLHAATEHVRRIVVPGMKWSLYEIVSTCKEYIDETNRRVTFEYCLLRDINDSDEQARQLTKLISGMNCHVNIIPYNRVSHLPLFQPTNKRIQAFEEILKQSGINVTRRIERGADIDAACGQLRHKSRGSPEAQLVP